MNLNLDLNLKVDAGTKTSVSAFKGERSVIVTPAFCFAARSPTMQQCKAGLTMSPRGQLCCSVHSVLGTACEDTGSVLVIRDTGSVLGVNEGARLDAGSNAGRMGLRWQNRNPLYWQWLVWNKSGWDVGLGMLWIWRKRRRIPLAINFSCDSQGLSLHGRPLMILCTHFGKKVIQCQ